MELTSTVLERWAAVDPATSPGADYLPVAVGSEFTPEDVVAAYRKGLFPWPPGDIETRERVAKELETHIPSGTIAVVEPCLEVNGIPLPWYSPRERGVLDFSDIHIPKSLRREIRSTGWVTTANQRFDDVLTLCAARDGEDSWITQHFQVTYQELHRLGQAHSIEVWEDNELIGGAFGIATGRIFTGEATFYRRSNASKIAILDMAARVMCSGGELLDAQVLEPPVARLGAKNIPRDEFLERLHHARDQAFQFETAPKEAAATLAALAEGSAR